MSAGRGKTSSTTKTIKVMRHKTIGGEEKEAKTRLPTSPTIGEEGKEEKTLPSAPPTVGDTKRTSISTAPSTSSSSSSSSIPRKTAGTRDVKVHIHEDDTKRSDEREELLNPASENFIMKLQASSSSAVRDATQPTRSFDYNQYYSLVESSIMRHLDYLDGVTSSIVEDREKYPPTGIAFYRDATHAKPLSERLSPDDPQIEAQNMFLRALNTLRGIDHVLAAKGLDTDRQELLKSFSDLIAITMATLRKEKGIKKAHKAFNTSLIRILHKNNLDAGLSSASDYIALLNHYRDLASTLGPAKSLVTVVNEEIHKKGLSTKITHTETAHPITVKTDMQKAQLAVMKDITSRPTKEKSKETKLEEKTNFHSAKKTAFQVADAAFADLIAQDDRRLPAQTRKTIGPTAKNAYVVHNELSFENLNPEDKYTIPRKSDFWSLRCGSPVFVGEGASEEQLREYTSEIVKQLQAAAASVGKININFTMLITDASGEHQNRILAFSKAAAKEIGATWAHAPSNFQGQWQPIDIDPALTKKIDIDLSSGRDAISTDALMGKAKANRINKAVEIVLHVSTLDNTINVTFCASGQDRTGTLQETATQDWAVQQYHLAGLNVTREHIERVRGLGLHNAIIASFAAPGSTGMKNDSRAWRHFTDDTNKYLYRESADTNKKNPVTPSEIEKIRGTPLTETAHHRAELKEEKKTDAQDFNKFASYIERIYVTYIGSTHKEDLLHLVGEINKARHEKDVSPSKKLDKMITITIHLFWKEFGIKKYGKGERYSNDQLIDKLNSSDRGKHTSLRNIGELLQHYTTLSETGKSIIPEKAIFHRISKTEITHLISNMTSLNELVKNPKLAAIIHHLSADQSDKGFTKAVNKLNTLWIEFANKGTGILAKASSFLKEHKSISHFEKSNRLIKKLNSNTERPLERGIATILQNISRQHPNKLYPPISTLAQPLVLEAKRETPRPNPHSTSS